MRSVEEWMKQMKIVMLKKDGGIGEKLGGSRNIYLTVRALLPRRRGFHLRES